MTKHIPLNELQLVEFPTPTKAWQIIENQENWCQNVLALDKYGNEVNVRAPQAVRFCALGAIMRVYNECGEPWAIGIDRLRDVIIDRGGDSSIADYNNTRSHAEVLSAMKEADV